MGAVQSTAKAIWTIKIFTFQSTGHMQYLVIIGSIRRVPKRSRPVPTAQHRMKVRRAIRPFTPRFLRSPQRRSHVTGDLLDTAELAARDDELPVRGRRPIEARGLSS